MPQNNPNQRQAKATNLSETVKQLHDDIKSKSERVFHIAKEELNDGLNMFRKRAAEIKQRRKLIIPKKLPMHIELLKQGWVMIAEAYCTDHNLPKYDIDDNNREAIQQLFNYFTFNEAEFNGDLNKGLLVIGNYGSGKTIAMEIFKEWILTSQLNHAPWNQAFYDAKCTGIALAFTDEKNGGENSLNQYVTAKRWMFDDLGKELEDGKTYQHFGTRMNVMAYILEKRYDLLVNYGIKTFATSNFPLVAKENTRPFKNLYGSYIDDRMNQLFNVIVFKGKSRRK